jgi:hypothetical protein
MNIVAPSAVIDVQTIFKNKNLVEISTNVFPLHKDKMTQLVFHICWASPNMHDVSHLARPGT